MLLFICVFLNIFYWIKIYIAKHLVDILVYKYSEGIKQESRSSLIMIFKVSFEILILQRKQE